MENKTFTIKNLQNIIFKNHKNKIHMFNLNNNLNQTQIKKIINNSENRKILLIKIKIQIL